MPMGGASVMVMAAGRRGRVVLAAVVWRGVDGGAV
jgi:hypothetical protein